MSHRIDSCLLCFLLILMYENSCPKMDLSREYLFYGIIYYVITKQLVTTNSIIDFLTIVFSFGVKTFLTTNRVCNY